MLKAAIRLTDPDQNRVLSFRQPPDIDVKKIAKIYGTSINGLLRDALIEYLNRHKPTMDQIDDACV